MVLEINADEVYTYVNTRCQLMHLSFPLLKQRYNSIHSGHKFILIRDELAQIKNVVRNAKRITLMLYIYEMACLQRNNPDFTRTFIETLLQVPTYFAAE